MFVIRNVCLAFYMFFFVMDEVGIDIKINYKIIMLVIYKITLLHFKLYFIIMAILNYYFYNNKDGGYFELSSGMITLCIFIIVEMSDFINYNRSKFYYQIKG
ncbi:hypothetical protein ACJX0J_006802 [Zea mays]